MPLLTSGDPILIAEATEMLERRDRYIEDNWPKPATGGIPRAWTYESTETFTVGLDGTSSVSIDPFVLENDTSVYITADWLGNMLGDVQPGEDCSARIYVQASGGGSNIAASLEVHEGIPGDQYGSGGEEQADYRYALHTHLVCNLAAGSYRIFLYGYRSYPNLTTFEHKASRVSIIEVDLQN